MNKAIGIILSFLFLTMVALPTRAQDYNPLPVAVPSLQFAPDARGGAWAILVLPPCRMLIHNTGTRPNTHLSLARRLCLLLHPMVSKLVSGIHLLYASGYKKFGEGDLNTVSASLRYFTLGGVDVPDISGEFWRTVSPHELALDVAYSRKLSETFSGAVTLRYIRSDYSTGEDETTPGTRSPWTSRDTTSPTLLWDAQRLFLVSDSTFPILAPKSRTMAAPTPCFCLPTCGRRFSWLPIRPQKHPIIKHRFKQTVGPYPSTPSGR